MSSTKSQVAMATNISTLPTSSSQNPQKEYSSEETLGRQNSFGNRRGNMKGKHLTRSHAMRESTSPPRTPTPRADHLQMSPNSGHSPGYPQSSNVDASNEQANGSSNVHNNNSGVKLQIGQSTANRGNSPNTESPAVVVSSQLQQQQQQNVALSNEAEFPKLTPPKSNKINNNNNNGNNAASGISVSGGHHRNNSSGNNNNSNGTDSSNKTEYNNNNCNSGKKSLSIDLKSGGDMSRDMQKSKQYNASNALHQALNVGDSQRNQSSNLHNSGMNYQLNTNEATREASTSSSHHHHHYDNDNRYPRNDSQNSNISMSHDEDQQAIHYERSGGSNASGGINKKHRANSNSKSTKPRLKNISSSSGSVDVFNNPENSSDQYTDYGGTDLLSFFRDTLNKNLKDRHFLMKLEKELSDLIQDKSRHEIRFPSTSSYNRMLIHRAAAFFGLEHNVDNETQQCVIVVATKNSRIPEIRFKSLVDHRDESRRSILKRDTHSFDEARQSSYLCPERGGMLDRKAKSFEEREEDYERARSRIFNRSEPDANDDSDDYSMGWPHPQQPLPQRTRPNVKLVKMQSSSESRDGRSNSGAVPKAHGFGVGNYSGGPSLSRGDSINSSKSSGSRVFKQDSAGSTGTQWRLSPSSSGSIYHFDPSNLPPSHAYHNNQINNNNASSATSTNYVAGSQQAPSPQGPPLQSLPSQAALPPPSSSSHIKKNKLLNHSTLSARPADSTTKSAQSDAVVITTHSSTSENVAEISTQTVSVLEDPEFVRDLENSLVKKSEDVTSTITETYMASATVECDGVKDVKTSSSGTDVIATNIADPTNAQDVCDNAKCLSITTTTSTKNYDRIEVQKFKNQATSPNITNEREDNTDNRENSASSDAVVSATPHDQSSRNQPASQTTVNTTNSAQQSQPSQRDTPHSSRSTPYSNSDVAKRSSEEPRPPAATWTYTQSYQAPDGSTVFHSSGTPSGSPYCATTYQQGPDGSVYAIPQSMVYTYQPPVEGEVQSYFMPVYDSNAQRADGPTSLIPAGTQTIYPSAGGATMIPVASAYPATQFAAANGSPIYPGQVIYTSEQFTPGGPAVAAPAPPNSQLQQIPMATYPLGYPYPYNGYWGQTMTYYLPQQALTNAVAATPLLPAPPPPPAPPVAASNSAVTGPHVASGVSIVNSAGANALVAAAAAAGPPANTNVILGSVNNSSGSATYHGGTTYYGTGRIKRPPHSQYHHSPQSNHHVVAVPTSGAAGSTTTYHVGHALPALTLATPANATAPGGAPNDLTVAAGPAPHATTMYALPQHATIFSTNVYPYAAAAPNAPAPGPILQQTHSSGGPALLATPTNINPSTHSGAQTNAVIPNAVYAHPPNHSSTPASSTGSGTLHAPGPSAIPIVDPATLNTHSSSHSGSHSGSNGSASSYNVNSAPQTHSSSSTPHSAHSSYAPSARNPPLFSTPPSNSGSGCNSYSNSSTPFYYSHNNDHSSGIGNSSSNFASHEKRNNSSSVGKKPVYSSSSSSNIHRQNASYNSGGKQPLLTFNDARSSPGSSGSTYHGPTSRPPHHPMKKHQGPLLSGPPVSYINSSTTVVSSNFHHHNSSDNTAAGGNSANPTTTSGVNTSSINTTVSGTTIISGKPPSRLNASAAAFRHRPGSIDYRAISQRSSTSVSTNNSNGNSESNNTSPNSIVANTATPTTSLNAGVPPCYSAPAYLNSSGSVGNGGGGDHPPHPPHGVYLTRGTHMPPQVAHGAGGTTATAVAASAVLGTYNPGATGVYFKYGQTYIAHPLQHSRRSPSTDMRPPMGPLTGMYPTVNMMIPGTAPPPRHGQGGRHPNPNYKGNRPR